MAPEEQIDVFVSYSREDDESLQLLLPHLQALETQKVCTYFCDTRLQPGCQDVEAEIDRAVRSARVFLFLVSANSLASDFIEKHEVRVARERAECEELVIVPLLVKSAPWKFVNWLRGCQFAGTQGKGRRVRPFSAIQEDAVAREEFLSEVASQIAALIEVEPRPMGGDPVAAQLARLCDRDEQIEGYKAWKRTRQSKEYPPQIWFVFGEDKEDVAGLCDRLFHEQVCGHLSAAAEPSASLQVVEWPNGTVAAQSVGELLLKTMIEDPALLLSGKEWAVGAGQRLAEEIWQNRNCYSALGYRHEASLVENLDDLFHMLDGYLPMLEAASAHLTKLAQGGTPPVLCFLIGISFERTRPWTWWPRWPAQSRWWPLLLSRVAKIRRDAQRRSRVGGSEPDARSYHIGCLPELRSVGKGAVRAWLRRHCGPGHDHATWSDKIFGKRKHLPMRTLQPKLAFRYLTTTAPP